MRMFIYSPPLEERWTRREENPAKLHLKARTGWSENKDVFLQKHLFFFDHPVCARSRRLRVIFLMAQPTLLWRRGIKAICAIWWVFLVSFSARAEVIDRIVAVVENHIITQSDVRREREIRAGLG